MTGLRISSEPEIEALQPHRFQPPAGRRAEADPEPDADNDADADLGPITRATTRALRPRMTNPGGGGGGATRLRINHQRTGKAEAPP